jgi:hypothetical protein
MDVGLGNAKFERLKIIVSGAWSSDSQGSTTLNLVANQSQRGMIQELNKMQNVIKDMSDHKFVEYCYIPAPN